MESAPQYYADFGLMTEFGIARAIGKELIFDETIVPDFQFKIFEEEQNAQRKLGQSPVLFLWEEEKGKYSVSLDTFEELQGVFNCRDEDIAGNGYDWEAVVKYFIRINFPQYKKCIKFDSEAGMF